VFPPFGAILLQKNNRRATGNTLDIKISYRALLREFPALAVQVQKEGFVFIFFSCSEHQLPRAASAAEPTL